MCLALRPPRLAGTIGDKDELRYYLLHRWYSPTTDVFPRHSSTDRSSYRYAIFGPWMLGVIGNAAYTDVCGLCFCICIVDMIINGLELMIVCALIGIGLALILDLDTEVSSGFCGGIGGVIFGIKLMFNGDKAE